MPAQNSAAGSPISMHVEIVDAQVTD